MWLCLDQQEHSYVAVKFIKSAAHYTDAAKDEIEIMGSLKSEESAAAYLCSLLDSFALHGPNGRHLALVFPVLGMNLWDLVEQYAPHGLRCSVGTLITLCVFLCVLTRLCSIPTVRYIAAQLLAGVAYMHSRHVVHTDLKRECLCQFRVSPGLTLTLSLANRSFGSQTIS